MSEPLPDESSFEDSLHELERVVRDLEDGQLGLEDALARYERGVGLIRRCYDRLRQAEQRIQVLTGLDEECQPMLHPFKHEATAVSSSEPPRRPSRKRGGGETE